MATDVRGLAKLFRVFPTNRSLMMFLASTLGTSAVASTGVLAWVLVHDQLGAQARGDFLTRLVLFGAVIVAVICVVVYVAATATAVPMRTLRSFLRQVRSGDLTRRVRVGGRDELAQIGAELNATLDAITELLASVQTGISQLDDAGRRLTEVGGTLDADARRTLAEAEVVASSAERVSADVGQAASGVDDNSSGVQRIAASTADASRVATEGVAAAREAQATVARLGDSSAEIGTIVKLITAIAEQTNLLALNATIEAARVGEAGKGFAVVAGEVKDLAQKTAKATEDITARIRALQEESTSAGGALTAVGDVVDRTYALQTTIAAAVQEQAAATSEIGHHVRSAATVSADIAGSMETVAGAARATAAQAGSVRDVSGEVAGVVGTLQEQVARFRTR